MESTLDPLKVENMRIEINKLNADLFLELYTSVGWDPPCKEQVAKALENTLASFVAYDKEKPLGMVRVIGDCGMSFYLKDFVVIPAYQSNGIGKMLIESVEKYIRAEVGDWAVSLELISTIEAEKFYERMGFDARPCEWDGPGMFKMIRNNKKQ